SQPSLTAAIMRLEQALGSALFERKPAVTLTVLGHAVHPYLQRIVENADLARHTAQGPAARGEDGRRRPPGARRLTPQSAYERVRAKEQTASAQTTDAIR